MVPSEPAEGVPAHVGVPGVLPDGHVPLVVLAVEVGEHAVAAYFVPADYKQGGQINRRKP